MFRKETLMILSNIPGIIENNKSIANKFIEYFVNVGQDLASNISKTSLKFKLIGVVH